MSYMVHKLTQATAILAVVMAVVVLQLSSSAYGGETIKFDVAEDPTRFVFDKNGPLVESGLPDARGGRAGQSISCDRPGQATSRLTNQTQLGIMNS